MLKFNQIVFTKHAAERLQQRLGISVSPDSEYPLPEELILSAIRPHNVTKVLQETWVHTQGIFALIIDQSTREVLTVLTKEHHQMATILRQAKRAYH